MSLYFYDHILISGIVLRFKCCLVAKLFSLVYNNFE